MASGTQIKAPFGLGTLVAGVHYSFLLRDKDRGRVILSGFSANPASARLEFIPISIYERAMQSGKLITVPATQLKRMPPWLPDYESAHFDFDLALHTQGASVKSKEDTVNQRWSTIQQAAADWEQILQSDDPIQEMNHRARNTRPAQNETRFRLLLITYLSFGRNIWSLLPRKGGRGTYLRNDPKSNKPRQRMGRPSINGVDHGYDCTEDVKAKIKQGFLDHSRKGRSLSAIYRDALRKNFKCLTRSIPASESCSKRKTKSSRKETYHPNGDPFPSVGQFTYWAYKLLTREVVLKRLLGEQTYRSKHAAPEGSYSENKQDALEQVHMDASYSKDHPRSVLSDFALPKLCIVDLVCSTTGAIVGSAYRCGSEDASLYKQAIFCAGIPKSLFGFILGIPIKDEDYPIAVVPLCLVHDQGPGGSEALRNIHRHEAMAHDMTAAYSPQQNSTVEATHVKGRKLDGAPTHRVSNQTALDMARDRFLWTIAYNKSTSALRRVSPEQLSRGIGTVQELFVDLQNRGRIAGMVVSVDELVKRYVPRIELKVTNGFVVYKGVRYRSDELAATKFAKNIRRHEGAVLCGHALDISTRVIWLHVDNRLIMIFPVDQIRASADGNSMTILEHAEYDLQLRKSASDLVRNRSAMANWARDEYEAQTGKTSGIGVTVKGRPKVRGARQKDEVAAARP